MGFLDDVQASISRGTEAVGRGTKSTQLKMKMDSLLKERQGLAAQLGAALYEKCKDDAVLRQGAEALFDGIAAIDAQRSEIQAQIDALAAEAQASQAAAVVYTCPGCGSRVPATDLFCSGCGKPIAEIKAAAPNQGLATPTPPAGFTAEGKPCPNCGAPMNKGDLFCMSCGHKLEAEADAPEASSGVPAAAPAQSESAPVAPQAETRETREAPSAPRSAGHAAEPGQHGSDSATVEAAATSSETACPACGAAITSDDVFCGSCGHRL